MPHAPRPSRPGFEPAVGLSSYTYMGFCVNLLHETESDHVARFEGQWLLGLREKEVGDWRLQIPSCAGSPTPEKVVETPKVKAKRG